MICWEIFFLSIRSGRSETGSGSGSSSLKENVDLAGEIRPLSRLGTFRVWPACRGNSLPLGESCSIEFGDSAPVCERTCIVNLNGGTCERCSGPRSNASEREYIIREELVQVEIE